MENQNFIITSLQPWDLEIGSTIKNTALELSKKNRVMYINTPMDYTTWLRGDKNAAYKHRMEVIKKRVSNIRQINENMWVIDCPFLLYPVNKLPTTWLFDYINRINNKKIAKLILETTTILNFKNAIHIIDTDIYRSLYLKELINPKLSVYYCRDYVITKAYWKKNGTRLEPIIAAKADLVLTNSTFFSERFKQHNPNTYAIETGVNLELYNISRNYIIPNDLQSIPHPIVGYVGNINGRRLDSDLLLYLAQQRPQYNFVFVGFEDKHFSQHLLHQQKNVYFLGKKSTNVLPDYIYGFDICINPQIVNEITEGNYPLKIDEYLAMGKPIVATRTHTMKDVFSEWVFLASDKSEYLLAMDSAMEEINNTNKNKGRVAFAHTHSWENSVQKIYNCISNSIKNGTPIQNKTL